VHGRGVGGGAFSRMGESVEKSLLFRHQRLKNRTGFIKKPAKTKKELIRFYFKTQNLNFTDKNRLPTDLSS
jgi:hypothetical protein